MSDSVIGADVPPAIRDMIEKCWDKRRERRFTAVQCYTCISQVHNVMSKKKFDIFFSHPWAEKPFLCHVYSLLVGQGYRVWYDQNDMGYDLHKSMREGIEGSHVVLACVNSVYEKRPNCMFELEETRNLFPDKIIVALFLENMFGKVYPPKATTNITAAAVP